MSDFFELTNRGTRSYAAGKKFGVLDSRNGLMAISEGFRPIKDRYDLVVEHVADINFSPIDHNAGYEALYASERKCDCFLHTNSRRTLVFVEIKHKYTSADLDSAELNDFLDQHRDVTRESVAADEWIDDVIDQLESTIKRFKTLNPTELTCYPCVNWAVGANSRIRDGVEFSIANKQDDFYLRTQFELLIRNHISIPSDPPQSNPIQLSLDELKSLIS